MVWTPGGQGDIQACGDRSAGNTDASLAGASEWSSLRETMWTAGVILGNHLLTLVKDGFQAWSCVPGV